MTNNIDRRNQASPEAKADFVKRVESIERQKESEKGAFMKKCATLNEEIKSILDEAKDAGIPKASLKAVLSTRSFERKAQRKREALEADDLAIFVSIREALGDYAELPLGAAAVEKAGEQDPTTAAIVDAVMSDEDKAAEGKRRDEEFEAADPARKAAPASIDPAAARRNRSAKKDVRATADKYAPREAVTF